MAEDSFHTSWPEVEEEVDKTVVDQGVEEEASFHTVVVEDRNGDGMVDLKLVDESEQLSAEDLTEHADCTEDSVSEAAEDSASEAAEDSVSGEELTKLEVGKKDGDTDHVWVLVVAVLGNGEALSLNLNLVG